MGLGLPCCIFTHSDNITVIDPGDLSLFSPPLYLLPMFGFWQEFLAGHALVLSLDEVIVEYSRILLPAKHVHVKFFKEGPWRDWSWLSWSPGLFRPQAIRNSMITVMKVATTFASATRPSLLYSLRSSSPAFQVGLSITSSRKLSSMLSTMLPLGLFVLCCVVPITNIKVIEVPHENQGLWLRKGICWSRTPWKKIFAWFFWKIPVEQNGIWQARRYDIGIM